MGATDSFLSIDCFRVSTTIACVKACDLAAESTAVLACAVHRGVIKGVRSHTDKPDLLELRLPRLRMIQMVDVITSTPSCSIISIKEKWNAPQYHDNLRLYAHDARR